MRFNLTNLAWFLALAICCDSFTGARWLIFRCRCCCCCWRYATSWRGVCRRFLTMCGLDPCVSNEMLTLGKWLAHTPRVGGCQLSEVTALGQRGGGRRWERETAPFLAPQHQRAAYFAYRRDGRCVCGGLPPEGQRGFAILFARVNEATLTPLLKAWNGAILRRRDGHLCSRFGAAVIAFVILIVA